MISVCVVVFVVAQQEKKKLMMEEKMRVRAAKQAEKEAKKAVRYLLFIFQKRKVQVFMFEFVCRKKEKTKRTKRTKIQPRKQLVRWFLYLFLTLICFCDLFVSLFTLKAEKAAKRAARGHGGGRNDS